MRGIKPYEGTENYIFVSYSHSDKECVYPYIEMMADQGYRIWYDEGIYPGTEWSEIIAEKVANCTHLLVFVTKNSSDSHNCKRELNFAVHKEKNITPIFLDDAEMSAGMEMIVSSLQGVFRKKYTSDEELLQAISTSEGMELCRTVEPEELEELEESAKPEELEETEESSEDINRKIDKLVKEKIGDVANVKKNNRRVPSVKARVIIICAILAVLLATGFFMINKKNTVDDIIGLDEKITMQVGNTLAPKYEVISSKYDVDDIEFILSEDGIISINKKGKITAESEGEVTITLKIDDYEEKVLVVVEPEEEDEEEEEGTKKKPYNPGYTNNKHDDKEKTSSETEVSSEIEEPTELTETTSPTVEEPVETTGGDDYVE